MSATALRMHAPTPGALIEDLDRDGYAVLPSFLDGEACQSLIKSYDGPAASFRSTVTMVRHGFGRGEYRYFARPLPPLINRLRTSLYASLSGVANTWAERLDQDRRWPASHDGLVKECEAAGQSRPTPLLLRYGPGDYNRLHQDVYGDLVFPLQVVVLLSDPKIDFVGGELVLVEGRPRMQSRPIVVPLGLGDAVVIPVRDRPVAGARGWSRATMRHGVTELKRGSRHTLGLIFHDSK